MIENQNDEINRLREGYNNSVKKDLILKMLDLKKELNFIVKKIIQNHLLKLQTRLWLHQKIF